MSHGADQWRNNSTQNINAVLLLLDSYARVSVQGLCIAHCQKVVNTMTMIG